MTTYLPDMTAARWVDRDTAATLASTSRRTIDRLIDSGELPCYRLGEPGELGCRTVRIAVADLDALIRSRPYPRTSQPTDISL